MANDTVGERIRRYRRLRKWTQEQLAEQAGTTKAYIGKIEAGVIAEPGLDVQRRIAKALSVQMRQIADPGWYDEQSAPPAAVVIAGRNFKGLTEQDIRVLEQMAELLETKQPDER